MGRRGTQPTPTALKLLRGTARADRTNPREPKPRARLPVRPKNLSERADEIWRRVIRDYGKTGVLTAVDGDVLRAYCEAVDRYEVAAVQLAIEGPLVVGARKSENPEMVKNPLHQIVRDNADLMRQMARELGLTPSARSGIRAPLKESDDDALGAWERAGK
jgi:P27 family predicted phage terminase small subunit